MERAATEQLVMAARLARPFQRFQLRQKQTGVGDSVDSNVVPASVRRSARQYDFDPHEAAMSGANRQPRGLCYDGRIGANPRSEQRAHAEALVLLVDDSGDDDLSAGILARSDDGCSTSRRDASFHVRRCAAID